MPWEIVALPALICFVWGLRNGLREARAAHDD